MTGEGLAAFREAIASVRPDLADVQLRPLTQGWDSLAIEAAGWIFKFPRTEAAGGRLRRECRLLALLRRRVEIPLPEMTLHEAPVLFSEHRMIPGDKMETPQYAALGENIRQAMAERMASFYVALHAVPEAEARSAGVEPIDPWPDATEIMQRNVFLPEDLIGFADAVRTAWTALPADETVLGYFDGHGWNMAFDYERGVLNGLYDFADAGFGPLHQDLCLSNFISPDLTLRIIQAYEQLAGRHIDRRRVMLLTAVQRLSELGTDASSKPAQWFVQNVADWRDFLAAHPEFGP